MWQRQQIKSHQCASAHFKRKKEKHFQSEHLCLRPIKMDMKVRPHVSSDQLIHVLVLSFAHLYLHFAAHWRQAMQLRGVRRGGSRTICSEKLTQHFSGRGVSDETCCSRNGFTIRGNAGVISWIHLQVCFAYLHSTGSSSSVLRATYDVFGMEKCCDVFSYKVGLRLALFESLNLSPVRIFGT